ncbi:MAG: hypothetical protein LBE24_07845 [Methylobacillus sp.]|nr:hypothetical protein [Methylobacillus sp.]
MIPHPEVVLVIGMVALYLYDSTMLLASNEAVLAGGKKRWGALFGADNVPMRNKEPLIPNPFLPHQPLYRFAWKMEGQSDPTPSWSPPVNSYARLIPSVWLMFLALFALIPLGLFALGPWVWIAGMALFYVNAILALTLVWFKRADYAVSNWRFAALAFECLACPPFALNLVRHLSLQFKPTEDFIAVMNQYLSEAEREAALAKIARRLRHAIDWETEASPRAAALTAHLQTIESALCRAPKSS